MFDSSIPIVDSKKLPTVRSLYLWSRFGVRSLILALSFCGAVFGILSPYFQKVLVDQWMGVQTEGYFFLGVDHFGEFELILATFGSLLVSILFSTGANFLGVRESLLAQRLCSQMLYDKILRLKTYEKKHYTAGDVVTLYAVDIPGSGMLLEQTVPLGAGVFFPFLLTPFLLWYGFGIPFWFTSFLLLFFIGIIIILALRQARFFNLFKKYASMRLGIVNEWIQNLKLIRVLHAIDWFERKIIHSREIETQNRVRMVTNGQIMGSIGSSVTFVINILLIIFLVYVLELNPTPGELLALLWIVGVFLSQSFKKIPWIVTFGIDASTSIQRLQSFFDLEESQHANDPIEEKSKDFEHFDIEVSGLNLILNQQKILKNIHFKIKSGECIAIVGEVGSGKTQLVLSLLGETPAVFEKYQIGFKSFLNAKAAHARQCIGFVPQENFILNATIGENISLHYQNKGQKVFDARFLESIKSAQLPMHTETFEDGLYSEIGEFGVNLSGGQKQRLSISRTVYYSKPILILDDALSALDERTEQMISQKLLFDEWKEKTRILITHRLSILPLCDRVFFMEKGELCAEGSYSELMQHSLRFREFMETKNSKKEGVLFE